MWQYLLPWLIDVCFQCFTLTFYRKKKSRTSVLIRKKRDLLNVRLHRRYLLCSPIEEVKVPKLKPNPLSRLSDELVRTIESFWVGSGVRRREQLLATVPEKRECKETILAENFFLRIFRNFFLKIFHLPRNLFP